MKKRINLSTFKEALMIVKAGKDSKGQNYNSLGALNQAAWIGENSGCLLTEIDRLREANAALRKAVIQATFAVPTSHGAFETLKSVSAYLEDEVDE